MLRSPQAPLTDLRVLHSKEERLALARDEATPTELLISQTQSPVRVVNCPLFYHRISAVKLSHWARKHDIRYLTA